MMKSEIDRNGVSDDVTLMDSVRNQELPQFYRAAEVLALPSYYEAFSKVAAEAMACGKPVVGTSAGGLPEVVEDGRTGILVRFGSVEGLTSALVSLLSDDSLRADMGKRGRERVLEMFTWRAVAEKTRKAYEELVSS